MHDRLSRLLIASWPVRLDRAQESDENNLRSRLVRDEGGKGELLSTLANSPFTKRNNECPVKRKAVKSLLAAATGRVHVPNVMVTRDQRLERGRVFSRIRPWMHASLLWLGVCRRKNGLLCLCTASLAPWASFFPSSSLSSFIPKEQLVARRKWIITTVYNYISYSNQSLFLLMKLAFWEFFEGNWINN